MKATFTVVYNRTGFDHYGDCSNMDCQEHFFKLSGIFTKKYKYYFVDTSFVKDITNKCHVYPNDDSLYLRKEFYNHFDFFPDFTDSYVQTCICGCTEKRTIKNVEVKFH